MYECTTPRNVIDYGYRVIICVRYKKSQFQPEEGGSILILLFSAVLPGQSPWFLNFIAQKTREGGNTELKIYCDRPKINNCCVKQRNKYSSYMCISVCGYKVKLF